MASGNLNIFAAAARSFLNLGLDYFPRPDAPAAGTKPASADSIMPDLSKAMAGWSALDGAEDCDIDEALDLAKASLAEVKAQTEYQDGKASRLLTVTSFVSALAGFLFTVFNANYPIDSLDPCATQAHWLPIAAYLLFLLFVLSALGGALTTFHATRTRFKYPISPRPGANGSAVSFLFHSGIVGVSPTAWAESYVEGAGKPPTFKGIKLGYLRNYVSETYLVAAKTADKLRYLQPAQSMLSWALRFLIAFAILFAVVVWRIAPTKPAPKPTTVQTMQPGGNAVGVTLVPPKR